MKRTRKWAYVAQEAERLARLGLTPREIAERLGLNKSTVTRWIAAGKLPKRPESAPREVAVPLPIEPAPPVLPNEPPERWAVLVRRTYALNATDDQLVTLAAAALTLARDPLTPSKVQLAAMARFQAIVKQLALLPPRELEATPPAPAPPAPAPEPRPARTDPRGTLLAIAPTRPQ